MTVTLNIAGIAFYLEIPQALFQPIAHHFSFFEEPQGSSAEAYFHVEVTKDVPVIDGSESTPKFHAVSPTAFVYGCTTFVFTIDTERSSGQLLLSARLVDPFAEIFSTFKWFFVFMVIARKGIPLHSSSIIMDKKAYLFSGASGKGKSTICGLLSSHLQKCRNGSDELNVIFAAGNDLYTYSTPFHSSNGAGVIRERVSLASVFFIEHCSSNKIEYAERTYAFRNLLQNVYHVPANREVMNLLVDSVCFLSEFPIYYSFFFINQPSVAECFNTFRSEINAHQVIG